MTEPKHTPWKVIETLRGKSFDIWNSEGQIVCSIILEKSTADLICQAVNSHDNLLEACETALNTILKPEVAIVYYKSIIIQLQQALAEAKEEL